MVHQGTLYFFSRFQGWSVCVCVCVWGGGVQLLIPMETYRTYDL